MADDEPELERAAGEDEEDGAASVSDEETVKGERDEEDDHRISDLLDEERRNLATPEPLGNGRVGDRYRELLRDEADAVSEDGSVDNVPRGVGSPVGSVTSAADDSVSVLSMQVRLPSRSASARCGHS